jgi:triphosphatase
MSDGADLPERQGVEQELKYELADADQANRYAATKELGSLRATGRPRQVQIEDRYVDTADGRLAQAGYAARLRSGPKGTLLSVKATESSPAGSAGAAPSAGSALHRRMELEGPADTSPDIGHWPTSAARSLILEHAGDAPLRELVTLRQLRRTRILADEAGQVELSVDDVEVIADGLVIGRFLELEVELRKGDASVLEGAMRLLEDDPALAPVATSKLERALELAGGPREDTRGGSADSRGVGSSGSSGSPGASGPAAAAPEPPRLIVGKTPGVTADDLLAEAGRKVLRFHLARMLAKEAGTRTGEQSEDLHGMRVATRRMRAAWRVYGDAFRIGRTKRLRGRLREVAGRLGAVRDLDVLVEALEAHRTSLPAAEGAALAPLVEAWSANREAARVLLLRALDAPWYGRFVEEYRAFVVTEGAGARPAISPVAPHRVRDMAASRIWLSYEQVRGYEPVLRWADVETLHDLRIAAKWLRYTMEFFREAMGPEVESCIAKVVALQDHLGWLHDADVTIALTRQFLVERSQTLSTAQVDAISTYLHGRERELEHLRRTVGIPWRGVDGIAFRRLLGRAVSGL